MQTLKKCAAAEGFNLNLNSVTPKSKPGPWTVSSNGKLLVPQNAPKNSKLPSLESERTVLPAWLLTHTMLSNPVEIMDRTSLGFL